MEAQREAVTSYQRWTMDGRCQLRVETESGGNGWDEHNLAAALFHAKAIGANSTLRS